MNPTPMIAARINYPRHQELQSNVLSRDHGNGRFEIVSAFEITLNPLDLAFLPVMLFVSKFSLVAATG